MAKAVKPAAKKKAAVKKAPKKTVAAKKTGTQSETGIKYADKSGGQPELVPIFEALKKMLLPYGKGTIKVRGGEGGQIILVSDKPIMVNGKKRDEYWFAAALVQKGYLGFYFMPAQTPAEKKALFKPELLQCLKGKSCFHIKKYDAEILQQVSEALAKGYQLQKERGWL